MTCSKCVSIDVNVLLRGILQSWPHTQSKRRRDALQHANETVDRLAFFFVVLGERNGKQATMNISKWCCWFEGVMTIVSLFVQCSKRIFIYSNNFIPSTHSAVAAVAFECWRFARCFLRFVYIHVRRPPIHPFLSYVFEWLAQVCVILIIINSAIEFVFTRFDIHHHRYFGSKMCECKKR